MSLCNMVWGFAMFKNAALHMQQGSDVVFFPQTNATPAACTSIALLRGCTIVYPAVVLARDASVLVGAY